MARRRFRGNGKRSCRRVANSGEIQVDDVVRVLEPTPSVRRRSFPAWHFAMLNDAGRSSALENMVAGLDLKGKTVLEIGAGCGLVALLFAKYGAEHVYTCEINSDLADVASAVIAHTPYRNRITLHRKSSAALVRSGILPRSPDIIFTETLGLRGDRRRLFRHCPGHLPGRRPANPGPAVGGPAIRHAGGSLRHCANSTRSTAHAASTSRRSISIPPKPTFRSARKSMNTRRCPMPSDCGTTAMFHASRLRPWTWPPTDQASRTA